LVLHASCSTGGGPIQSATHPGSCKLNPSSFRPRSGFRPKRQVLPAWVICGSGPADGYFRFGTDTGHLAARLLVALSAGFTSTPWFDGQITSIRQKSVNRF
jgi:hypothetical protein